MSTLVEARTIRNIEELREFCDAAQALAKIDPALIRLASPLDLTLVDQQAASGRSVYDVLVKKH
jgi:hypothetical protein